jgi:hypothetical protein
MPRRARLISHWAVASNAATQPPSRHSKSRPRTVDRSRCWLTSATPGKRAMPIRLIGACFLGRRECSQIVSAALGAGRWRNGGGLACRDGALGRRSAHGRSRCRPSGRTTEDRLRAIDRTADLRRGRRPHSRERYSQSQCRKPHVDCSVAGAWRRIVAPCWMLSFSASPSLGASAILGRKQIGSAAGDGYLLAVTGSAAY